VKIKWFPAQNGLKSFGYSLPDSAEVCSRPHCWKWNTQYPQAIIDNSNKTRHASSQYYQHIITATVSTSDISNHAGRTLHSIIFTRTQYVTNDSLRKAATAYKKISTPVANDTLAYCRACGTLTKYEKPRYLSK